MRLNAIFLLSAILWIIGGIWFNQIAIALLALLCHYIAWQTHVLEVKVNKLLDDRQIRVTREDINS